MSSERLTDQPEAKRLKVEHPDIQSIHPIQHSNFVSVPVPASLSVPVPVPHLPTPISAPAPTATPSSQSIAISNATPNPVAVTAPGPISSAPPAPTAVLPPPVAPPAQVSQTPTPSAAPAIAPTNTKKLSQSTGALQQQIQAQLQQQLQAQLQAAAARGQQANITPEQIQAQAQAMVQAAAQAQAVVSAAKSRGDGLVPMNAQQIAALSQIQAQAIVNARPQTALLASGTPTVDKDGKPVQPTQAQIQHQITLQAQALVHAHTQAQIAAGIYKGDTNATGASTATTTGTVTAAKPQATAIPSAVGSTAAKAMPPLSSTASPLNQHPAMRSAVTTTTTGIAAPSTISVSGTTTVTNGNAETSSLLATLTPAQHLQQSKLVTRHSSSRENMLKKHANDKTNLRSRFQELNLAVAPSPAIQAQQEAQLKGLAGRHASELAQLKQAFQRDLTNLHSEFRKQNAAAEYAGLKVTTLPNPSGNTSNGHRPLATIAKAGGITTTSAIGSIMAGPNISGLGSVGSSTTVNATTIDDGVSSTSPAFLEKLSGTLNRFWTDQLHQMRELGTDVPQTEQDFKNHNDLPLARIKRIMKSDEDVRMISAEAPVLFAKACEMFILELTLRSWSYSENNKRRTLQKEDIREAIQRTDIFDFLVDVIH